MSEDLDKNFGTVAVEKGYCSQAQLDDAVHTLNEVRRLGLDEKLGTILIKKKVMSEEQVRSVLKLQGQGTHVKLAGYEILGKIGQGGMGAVFKARQVSLDRVVALKVLTPKLAEDQTFCDRFIKEARSVAKLSHPNIIVGIDVGQQGKYYYFAMEYVDGNTTLAILRKEGPFSEIRALHMAFQIAQALDHAHKHGLVHRDIKPDNIMITARDEAKLCDLGLAKAPESDAGLTQVDSAVGTPHYIAPEQARGEVSITIGADLYALGATLYHLTTGTTLFSGPNSRDIMVQHLLGEAPHARKIRPELSEGFCRILEKMLAKDKAERYLTPADLSADIQRLWEHKPIKALAHGVKSSMARAPKSAGRRGESTTTGPRAPVSRPDDTTGLRVPLDRPEPSTGPKAAIRSPRVLIMLGAAATVLLLACLPWLFSAAPVAPPSLKALEDAKMSSLDPPAKPVGSAVSPKKDPPPLPKGAEKVPPPPLLWEPLEKARQTRQRRPDDYPTLIPLFEAIEKGAPPELVATVRREKAEMEAEVFKAFHEILKNRTREARLRMEAKNYPAALGLFQDADYPAHLLLASLRKDLAKVRSEFEVEILEVFNSSERQKLWEEFKGAEREVARLKELRKRLPQLEAVYPVKVVKDQLAILDKKLEQTQREVEASALKDQEAAYRKACDAAFTHATRDHDLALALTVAEEALANPALKERYGTRLELLKRDLQAALKFVQQAAAQLETKVNSSEMVVFHSRGSTFHAQIRSLGGASGKPGVLIRDSTGKEQRLLFAELEAEDVIALAGISERTAPGRYAKGMTYFWNGNLAPAFEHLKAIKEDPAFADATAIYLGWMEANAATLLEQLHALGKEVQNLKMTEAQVAEKREAMARLVKQLNRDYPATEVYRARTKK